MTTRLPLSVAISDNPRTRPLGSGAVDVQGADMRVTYLHPSEMFWRQLKFAEFDVSEMSLSSLMIAVSRGNRDWVGIPVFTMRSFFHTWGFKRLDRGIRTPSDLAGKRVGVPEYQQTSAIWSRGIFRDEFGLDPREVEWFMERVPERSHGGSTGFTPPPGVRVNQIAPDSSIGEMMMSGDLDATLLYLNDRNLVDRSRIDITVDPMIGPMFEDTHAEGRRLFATSSRFPINHTVVIRRSLLDANPWLALNIYAAFDAARALAHSQMLEAVEPWAVTQLDAAAARALRDDPMPYGVERNRAVLETISRYLFEDGLTGAPVDLKDVFAPATCAI